MKKKAGPNAYTEEFRREAVRLVEHDPTQLKRIARELGVAAASLRTWWQRAQAARPGRIAPPAGALRREEENRRPRQEKARLHEEREILKKAMAFFAKDA